MERVRPVRKRPTGSTIQRAENMVKTEQKMAKFIWRQQLATNRNMNRIKVLGSPFINSPATISMTMLTISMVSKTANNFFRLLSKHSSILDTHFILYVQQVITNLNPNVHSSPTSPPQYRRLLSMGCGNWRRNSDNQLGFIIIRWQTDKYKQMGNQCTVCDTVDTPAKNQLRPIQHSQLPPNSNNPTPTKSNPQQQIQGGFIVRENSKYFTEDQTQFNDNINANAQNTMNQAPEKKGMVVLKGGIKYQGEWVGGLKSGHGLQIWPDGAKYEGQWLKGKASGKGKFTHVEGDTYDGEWKDDKAHGYGVYIHFKTGAKYQGYWQNDMQHGSGVQTYSDGNKYQGMFKQGKRNGQGIYYLADGTVYMGQWVNGRIEGKGICQWKDGRRYDGSWLDNKKHGYGVYTWVDGRKYEGNYKNDKKHGTGTYTWSDGRKHVGEWKNDKRHGRGQYIVNQHNTKVGIWEDDRRIQWLNEENPQ